MSANNSALQLLYSTTKIVVATSTGGGDLVKSASVDLVHILAPEAECIELGLPRRETRSESPGKLEDGIK